MSKKYRLQRMGDASFEVQFIYIVGALAKMLGTTKKALRKAKRIVDKEKFTDLILVKGTLKEMTFHHGFRSFILKEKKKNRIKHRKILAPHPRVQEIFNATKDRLVELKPAHEKAFGFVKGRDIQRATRTLIGNAHFFSFDISNAFPSITDEMVEEALAEIGIGEELIKLLAWFVTYDYENRRRLPQGSSCSPALLNLVYQPMCEKMDEFCQAHSIEWFVYADDFNFAAHNITSEIKNGLLAIVAGFGFSIKKKKTKDNLGKTIPHVLGLTIVNGEIHNRRATKNRFRRIFFAAWKFGDSAYSHEQVVGIAAAVRQTYGEEENWPGWVKKYWIKYKEKHRKEKRRW